MKTMTTQHYDLKPDKICCAFCGRSASDIKGFIQGPINVRGRYWMDVLYVTKSKHPVCGRCISEHDIAIVNNGDAVVQAIAHSNDWRADEFYYPRLQLSRIMEVGVPDDQELTIQGVNFKL